MAARDVVQSHARPSLEGGVIVRLPPGETADLQVVLLFVVVGRGVEESGFRYPGISKDVLCVHVGSRAVAEHPGVVLGRVFVFPLLDVAGEVVRCFVGVGTVHCQRQIVSVETTVERGLGAALQLPKGAV